MFFTAMLMPTASLFAQRPKASNSTTPTGGTCNGAWTGSMTYKRTQTLEETKTVDRVSARGKDTKSIEMKLDYKAQVAVIEDPSRNGGSIGRATVVHKFTSSEKTQAVEKNSCDQGKTWRDMKGTFINSTETKATEAGVQANVTVGLNMDGTYSVSLSMSPIIGETTGKESSEYSGQCKEKNGNTYNHGPVNANIPGQGLRSDGRHRYDPASPNKISGSYTADVKGGSETITWNLRKCGAPLQIVSLAFDDMKFPNWNDWQELNPQTGTTDGNQVRVRVKVLNASGEQRSGELSVKETFTGDKYNGSRPDMPIKDSATYVRLDPGEEREIELLWDTSGYAWFDDGRPRSIQHVKAEIWENNKLVDNLTEIIKFKPKPIVLVHGLRQNWRQFEGWQNVLTTTHSYDWKAFPVGEKPEKGRMFMGDFATENKRPPFSIQQNATALKTYIEYAQTSQNAWHVDIVAHSTGGQVARVYISQMMPATYGDGRPQVTNLLTLGTPHLGSKCADLLYLFSRDEDTYQATTEFADDLNRRYLARRGVRFAALGGDGLATVCKSLEWGDGFVTLSSAHWDIADKATTDTPHEEMTGNVDFTNFVKPRLAKGPQANHLPDVSLPTLP